MQTREEATEVEKRTRPRTTKHSAELKVTIARRIIEEHVSQAELARQTKISATNIHKWVYLARRGELPGYTRLSFDNKTGDLVAENRRLLRELSRVTMERDFLERAAAFFAKETP